MRGIALICVLLSPVAAEQLPIRAYSSSDGLPHNEIHMIFGDARGFIWFCTSEGLSRFDGQSFRNFGVADGLPHRMVSAVMQTRNGEYWVGTIGGLARLVPSGRQPFESFVPGDEHARDIDSLLEARDGTIWVGTGHGLYRVVRQGAGQWRMELADLVTNSPAWINGLVEDSSGQLWIGTAAGLFRRLPGGQIERFGQRKQLASIFVEALVQDHAGRIWVGTRSGLYRLVADPKLDASAVEHRFTTADGLGSDDIKSLVETPDRALWAGTLRSGLTRLTPSDTGFQARVFTLRNGLTDDTVFALASDSAGNIWAGESAGVVRISPNGFIRYTTDDGLPSMRVDSVFQTPSGLVCTTGERRAVACFDGRKFHTVLPKYRNKFRSWSWSQVMLQDRGGEWWVALNDGLERFPALRFAELAGTRPKKQYRMAADDTSVLRIFEDSHGDIWALCWNSAIYRWERATDRLVQCRQPSQPSQTVGAFGEDHAGNIWIGLTRGEVLRYKNGTFRQFSTRDGVRQGDVRTILCDRLGRLWLAYSHGLGRVEDPAAEQPHFQTYTTAHGLSSDGITCLTDDQWGRIYAGTNKSVDQLDPATGAVRHYSAALGLPVGTLYGALRDRSNQLWFASSKGLLSLRPELDRPAQSRAILFTALEIAGRPYPVSRLGEDRVTGLELQPSQSQIRIGFVAPGPDSCEPLSYQFRVNGGEWSAPATEQTVNLVGLKPGPYDLSVRALSPDPGPVAQLAFTIVPPLWQRWWFITLAAALIALTTYAIHRLLVAQLLSVERMRTRIAVDLHDDIGSSLSQIAIMSELAQRSGNVEAVPEIACLSRDLVDAMSDIVWAINPKHDHLSNLVHRMRRFADDTLGARDIHLQFGTTRIERDIPAPADVRRQVFLIFKEAVTNIARHSRARSAEVKVEVDGGLLRLSITDDGQGFDPQRAAEGNGIVNIRERARKLGGVMELTSQPGRGTMILVTAPLAGKVLIPR